MIHFLTVHWRSTRWIDPQLDYIRRHTRTAYRVVAAVDPSIPVEEHRKFAEVLPTPIGPHAEKLNLLGKLALRKAVDDDWLVFIDSDCFPIVDWTTKVADYLGRYELAAVRRDENVGDKQPHPCFAVTTAGFWRRIGGDWGKGYHWSDQNGSPVTDVGGNLLQQLEEANVEWLPLLRSNRIDYHPVFFGIYDGLVYHHGAGSRRPHGRADRERIRSMVPTWRRRLMHALGVYERHVERQVDLTAEIGERFYGQLLRDPDFYRQFMAAGPSR